MSKRKRLTYRRAEVKRLMKSALKEKQDSACQREAMDRKDAQAALLGADLALGISPADRALAGALKMLRGGK